MVFFLGGKVLWFVFEHLLSLFFRENFEKFEGKSEKVRILVYI